MLLWEQNREKLLGGKKEVTAGFTSLKKNMPNRFLNTFHVCCLTSFPSGPDWTHCHCCYALIIDPLRQVRLPLKIIWIRDGWRLKRTLSAGSLSGIVFSLHPCVHQWVWGKAATLWWRGGTGNIIFLDRWERSLPCYRMSRTINKLLWSENVQEKQFQCIRCVIVK